MGWGIRWLEGPCLGCCSEMSMWALHVCSGHWAGPANRAGTREWLTETSMWARVPGRHRSLVSTRGNHKYVCVCESGECCLCTCTSELLPLPAQEQEKTWLCLCFMLVLYVVAVEGRVLSATVCITGCDRVLLMCPQVALPLVVPANRKAEAVFLSLGRPQVLRLVSSR